jgi:hypothetical protein
MNDGMTLQASMDAPKSGKAALTMKTAELEEVAWLADSGLRLWISPRDEPTRPTGPRLAYERGPSAREAAR